MYYKQFNSGGQLLAVGTTVENAVLPDNFVQISKSEYDSFQRVFSVEIDIPTLTPLNENHELILN